MKEENVEVKGEIHKDGYQVYILISGSPLKDMKGGSIVTCKRCGEIELANKGSFCDRWKLCRKCARKELKKRGIIRKN